MDALLAATLEHLRALVRFDTRNPPRAIDAHGIFDYLRAQSTGFDVRITDHGSGSVSMLATRGRPGLLFNVHLDTVPDSAQWTADPFTLRVAAGRAIGLGACDIKGAAAGLLAAAQAGDGAMALLFTTDEEGSSPRCVHEFLAATGRAHAKVVVAEPTGCRAVLAHRGIQSLRVRFRGRAGHASREQRPGDSALHQAVRWCDAALNLADARSAESFGGLRGLRFNLGRIEGGIKANMIAADAEVRVGMRPLPSVDPDALLADLRALADPPPAAFDETFRGPPLPAAAADAGSRLADARGLAGRLGLEPGPAVDFWTEAALFSQAGGTALVYGPGDIAQAHSADEWVALDQLRDYAAGVQRIVAGGAA